MNKKTFTVQVVIEVGGILDVKAATQEEAEEKVKEALHYDESILSQYGDITFRDIQIG